MERQTEARERFRQDLQSFERDLLEMGELAEEMVGKAVRALLDGDVALADAVIEQDDDIDRRYLSVERRWLETLARQSPVAGDLRLMAVVLHMNHDLERIGDQAVNVAKVTLVTQGLPTNQTILTHIREMGDVVQPMLRVAMESFAKRELQLALRLPEMDEPVDRLNRNMYKEVAACGSDQALLEWAVRMMVVARYLERVGDRAVDIGEQVAFLLTGVFREFTDETDLSLFVEED